MPSLLAARGLRAAALGTLLPCVALTGGCALDHPPGTGMDAQLSMDARSERTDAPTDREATLADAGTDAFDAWVVTDVPMDRSIDTSVDQTAPDSGSDATREALDDADAGTDAREAATDAANGDAEAGTDAAVIRDSAPSGYRTIEGDLVSLALHGPAGGSAGTVTCARPNDVVVGLYGYSGSDALVPDVVNRVGLVCATLRSDGTIGEVRVGDYWGGDDGPAYDDRCPAGQLLVRINGRAGQFVDRIQGVCAAPAAWLDAMTYGTTLSARGGGGGTAFTDSCPAGYVLHGFTATTDLLLFRTRIRTLRASCIRLQR